MTTQYRFYALHGADGIVRYVGRTRTQLIERYRSHVVSGRKADTPFRIWINEQGENLTLIELERMETPDWWATNEVTECEAKWIAHYLSKGWLFNKSLTGKRPKIVTLDHQKAELGSTALPLAIEAPATDDAA